MFVDVISNVKDQGKKCHADGDAVVRLAKNRQVGIFIQVVIELIGVAT